jgi:polygalacturonase
MTNKQSYIINLTIKTNIKTNCICREKLVNQERFDNMDDERYMISTYNSTENLTKFYKTRYSNFFIMNNYMKSIDDL